jgi:CheY-like chemotaxis protein
VIHLRNELLQHLEEQFPEHIVEAFKKVPREEFVPDKHRKYAYADIALPIGEEQTISQPTTIAFMLQLLDTAPDHTVLELGSGGGYVLALLSVLAKNGQEALEIYKREKDRIILVLLDLIMPVMGGRETYRRIRSMDPKIKIGFTSGYTPHIYPDLLETGEDFFIQKPFHTEELLEKVRKMIKHSLRDRENGT